MVQIVRSNKAFSLIEVLVAIVIIGISIMGLMEMSIVVMKNNLKNEMRNKAVEVLDNHLRDLTSKGYYNIRKLIEAGTGIIYDEDNESVRNINVKFEIVDNITENTLTNTLNISSEVKWKCCGKDYSYEVETVVTRE